MSGEMGTSDDVEASITRQSGSFVPLGKKSTRIQHLSAATGLILTYLIEIGVQISLTIHFCESWIPQSSEWGWVWLVCLSLGISSLVVSSISLIWVCHSLDFAGRLCGRLLCYVMHVFLLGIPWRYLKLAFAYDPADVQEFIALRIFQTYIQSLPLTAIHLASLITFHQSWTCIPVWLVVAECMSIVVALIIASYITPLPSPADETGKNSRRKTTRCFQENLKCSTSPSAPGDESDLWCRVVQIELNLLSRGLLLACRLVSLGILLGIVKYWTSIFILGHILVAVTWTRVTTSDLTLSRTLQCSYVIFWDVTSTLCGELDLVTWCGPVVLVLLENMGVLTLAHWHLQDLRWLITGTSAGILFGSLLFALLNLSRLTPWRTLFGTRVPSNQSNLSAELDSSGTPSSQGSKERENSNLVITSPHYVNISEKLMTTEEKFGRKREQESAQWEKNVTPLPSSVFHSIENSGLGQLETTWVPDTCCNDSNGSSNSRNTNTLLEPVVLDSLDPLDPSDFVFCFPSGRRLDGGRLPKELPLVTSTPLEIKTAARVIMNIPRHVEKGGSRCPCSGVMSVPEKLIEDPSYGILFCESGDSPGSYPDRIPNQSSRSQQARIPLKLRILCAKCLQNHDPLLTDCQEDNEKIRKEPIGRLQSINPILPSETTDYPSETEMTWTGVDEEEGDEESGVTSLHSRPLSPTAQCHHHQTQRWTMFPPWTTEESLPKEFTSREYVRTWLLTSQTIQRHHHYQQQKMRKHSNKYYKTIHLPIRSNNQRRVKGEQNVSSLPGGRESPLATSSRNNLYYKDLEIIV